MAHCICSDGMQNTDIILPRYGVSFIIILAKHVDIQEVHVYTCFRDPPEMLNSGFICVFMQYYE